MGDNASITSYLCDQGPARGHVRAVHRGKGLWRVESVDDPTVGFWHKWVDQKTLIESAQDLRRLLTQAVRAETLAKQYRRDAKVLCGKKTAAMIDAALAEEVEDGVSPSS